MRAAVGEREIFAADVEHADLAARDGDDLALRPARSRSRGRRPDGFTAEPYNALALSRNTLRLLRVGHRELERVLRVVEVPVRIVGREHQPVPADPLDHLGEVLRIVRLLDRLRGEPDVLADVFRRRALHVRHLRAHAAPSACPCASRAPAPRRSRPRSARPSASGSARTRPRTPGWSPCSACRWSRRSAPACSRSASPSRSRRGRR